MPTRFEMQPMSIILAVDEAGGFGKDGKIPWNFPEDLKHFQETTKGSACVMGRATYEDMLQMRKDRDAKKENPKPIEEILPGRESFVVTSEDTELPGAARVSSLREAVQSVEEGKQVFVIGGYRLFIEAMAWADTIHLTIIKGTYDCDRFFPVHLLNNNFKIADGTENDDMRFVTYKRTTR